MAGKKESLKLFVVPLGGTMPCLAEADIPIDELQFYSNPYGDPHMVLIKMPARIGRACQLILPKDLFNPDIIGDTK